MKRIIPLFLLVVVAGAAWYLSSKSATNVPSQQTAPAQPSTGASNHKGDNTDGHTAATDAAASADQDDEDMEGLEDEDLRPAAERYTSAEQALAAVKAAAGSYDDLVLEQFMTPGEECSWCPEFYKGVRELAFSPQTKSEERSYYAELLAISGRLDNITALMDGIKNAPNQEEKDIFLESLELSMGGDDVVKYLGEQMQTDDTAVKESVVAAITNQGSRLSAELLYQEAVSSGDPDGYYSSGIGLGELVPDDSTIPYLQEIALKRDAYSHLAVKSLLNNGVNGVRVVFDVLTNSKDPDFDRRMLKDAIDHVVFDEEIESFVTKISQTSKQPVVSEFAKQILDEFKSAEQDDTVDDGANEEG